MKMTTTIRNLLIARGFDIGTTYLFVKLWGLGVEGNPVGGWFLENWGFVGFAALNAGIVWFLSLFEERRLGRLSIIALTLGSFVAAGWNLAWIVFFILYEGR